MNGGRVILTDHRHRRVARLVVSVEKNTGGALPVPQGRVRMHPIDMYPQQHAAVGGRLFLAHLAGFMETRTQTTGLRRNRNQRSTQRSASLSAIA